MKTTTAAPAVRAYVTADLRWQSARRALYLAEQHGRPSAAKRDRERDTWAAREQARVAAGIPAV